MRISTILLFASWIPLIQVLFFRFNFTLIPLSIILSIMGWLTIRGFRKKFQGYKPIINFILLLLFSIILFGIPVLSCIAKLFYTDFEVLYDPHTTAGLYTSIISATISCAALLLAWREAQKEEKPYFPVLKFILASIFVIWQLNLGFHLYTQMASIITGHGSLGFWIGESKRLATPRQILSIFYITVNILFFSDILLRRKLKNGHYLFFPGAGLLILSGTYMLITLPVAAVELLPEPVDISLFVVTLSFITVIGPVLIFAVILSSFGGILALFKGIRDRRIPASVVKGVFLSTITIILYMLLFKSLWPVRDPSMNVLIRMMKENMYRGSKHCVIVPGCYYELFSFGKSAQGLFIEKLNDGDAFIRRESAFFLQYLGGQRAVPPLVIALKDTDEGVRRNVIFALGKIGDQRAIIPLIETLKDEDSGIKAYAAKELIEKLDGNIPGYKREKIIEALLEFARERYKEKHKMIATLINALKYEKTMVVKSGVVEVLSDFRDIRVVEILLEKLKGNIPNRLKSKINEALQEITRENYEGEPEEMSVWWQEWWDKNMVEFIRKMIDRW